MDIRFIGLEKTKLMPSQVNQIKEIAAKEASRLQRRIHNDFDITIHIKEYKKEAKKQKYSVNLKIKYPGQIISSNRNQGGSWDIHTAVRKAFHNMDNELKKKFKGDS